MTVEFTVLGQAFVGLNAGPAFKPNEAVSFQVMTDDQAETDRYWNAIIENGGSESAVQLVQGSLGLFLADRAASLDGRAQGSGSRRREAGDGGHDDHGPDRHCQD